MPTNDEGLYCQANIQTKFLFSGNGSYIYIETSHPRRYHERAKLYSPWMRGIQRLTFFYFMYGSAIETLSVYVRDQMGEELKVWSRHGGILSGSWSEGCATLNYSGSYQVASQISLKKSYYVVRKKKFCSRFDDLRLECCYMLVDYYFHSQP